MVGWHHRLNGRDFEQAPGVDDGQGGLACCDSQGHKESDTTEATQQQQQQHDVEIVADFILGGSKITADDDCSHEIKRRLLLGRKVMTNLDSIL